MALNKSSFYFSDNFSIKITKKRALVFKTHQNGQMSRSLRIRPKLSAPDLRNSFDMVKKFSYPWNTYLRERYHHPLSSQTYRELIANYVPN